MLLRLFRTESFTAEIVKNAEKSFFSDIWFLGRATERGLQGL